MMKHKTLKHLAVALVGALVAGGFALAPARAQSSCPAGRNDFAVRTSGSADPFVCRTNACQPIGRIFSQTASAGWCILGICYPARPAFTYEIAGKGPGQPAQHYCPAWLQAVYQ